MTYEDMITLQTIVEDEVEFTFGDWGEGQGIGSSDVSAVMNAVVPQVMVGLKSIYLHYET